MTEFRYDTQLLIEGNNLDEGTIARYFTENFKGDCLLAVGDSSLIVPRASGLRHSVQLGEASAKASITAAICNRIITARGKMP